MPETNTDSKPVNSQPLHSSANVDDALDLDLRAAITLAPGFTLTVAPELAEDDDTKYLVDELRQMLDRDAILRSVRHTITMLIEQGDEGESLDELLEVIGWIDNLNCSDLDEGLARKANVLLAVLSTLNLHDLVSIQRRSEIELREHCAVNRRLEWERWTDDEKELHRKMDRRYWPRIPADWKVCDVEIVDNRVKITRTEVQS